MELSDHIIAKSMGLMSRLGVTSVTMDMIASSCGISKRTLYENFPDKRTLLRNVLESICCEREKRMAQAVESVDNKLEAILKMYLLVRERVTDISEAFTNDVERLYPDLLAESQSHEDEYTRRIVLLLRQGQQEGVIRKTRNTELLASYFMVSIRLVRQYAGMFPAGVPLRRVLDAVFINFMRGIASSRGLEIIDKTLDDHKIVQ